MEQEDSNLAIIRRSMMGHIDSVIALEFQLRTYDKKAGPQFVAYLVERHAAEKENGAVVPKYSSHNFKIWSSRNPKIAGSTKLILVIFFYLKWNKEPSVRTVAAPR